MDSELRGSGGIAGYPPASKHHKPESSEFAPYVRMNGGPDRESARFPRWTRPPPAAP